MSDRKTKDELIKKLQDDLIKLQARCLVYTKGELCKDCEIDCRCRVGSEAKNEVQIM